MGSSERSMSRYLSHDHYYNNTNSVCLALDCGPPVVIRDIALFFSSTSLLERATYTCPIGKWIEGTGARSVTVVCQVREPEGYNVPFVSAIQCLL